MPQNRSETTRIEQYVILVTYDLKGNNVLKFAVKILSDKKHLIPKLEEVTKRDLKQLSHHSNCKETARLYELFFFINKNAFRIQQDYVIISIM